jgi:hypothetical protein
VVVRSPARKVRSYLLDDVKRDLWLQMVLDTNHLNHEIGRLRADNELIAREVHQLTALTRRLLVQQSKQVDDAAGVRSTLTTQLDSIRALAQRAEAEVARQHEASLLALARVQETVDAARQLLVEPESVHEAVRGAPKVPAPGAVQEHKRTGSS